MTIIEKIKAEIERRIDAHHTHGHFCAEHEFRDVLSFLSTLESEKPVPADLEEAAKECCDNNYPTYQCCCDCIIEVFKAGAKWQREQMMKEAVEVQNVVEEGRYCQEIGPIFLDERAGFKPGDKVRVIVLPKED